MKIIKRCIIIFFLISIFPTLILFMLIGGYNANSNSSNNIQSSAKLSAMVESYRAYVEEQAKVYEMSDWVDLVLAVIQVESGGNGLDPMQASEGPFNKQYPKYPNGITDPYYSIQCGIQELKSVLKKANVENAEDIEKIQVALAGYNFGSGYIDWVNLRGGKWSLENATEFSNMMAERMGWSGYGDPPYPTKVLNYYSNYTVTVLDGDFIVPVKNAVMTSGFGGRELDGYHYGIDFDAGYGAIVYAPIDAKVYRVGTSCPGNGGYYGNMCPFNNYAGAGNFVQLEVKYKDELLYIIFCHLQNVTVSEGQTIKQGESIGAQGHSGNSTASHLHVEFHKDTPTVGTSQGAVDPANYFKLK